MLGLDLIPRKNVCTEKIQAERLGFRIPESQLVTATTNQIHRKSAKPIEIDKLLNYEKDNGFRETICGNEGQEA